jgi:hypothetical protein
MPLARWFARGLGQRLLDQRADLARVPGRRHRPHVGQRVVVLPLAVAPSARKRLEALGDLHGQLKVGEERAEAARFDDEVAILPLLVQETLALVAVVAIVLLRGK